MFQTFATLIHVAPKIEIEELNHVSKQLSLVLTKETVTEFQTNKDLLNNVVAANIDYFTPSQGDVIYRLCQLAKERNIDYTPSLEAQEVVFAYCDARGL